MISSLIFLTATSQCLPTWVRWWRPGWWVKHTLAPVGAVGQVGRTNLEALHLLLCGLGGVGVVGAFGRHAVEYGSSIRMQACGKKKEGSRLAAASGILAWRPQSISVQSVAVSPSRVLVLVSALLCTAATHATRAQLSVGAQRLLSGCSVDAAPGKEPPAAV
jgi:hypothetical protein